jgi:hypothetical protein
MLAPRVLRGFIVLCPDGSGLNLHAQEGQHLLQPGKAALSCRCKSCPGSR